MRTSTKQSRKSANALLITTLHGNVKIQRQTAQTLFKLAKEQLRLAACDTFSIKDLAKQQVQLKRELKGPAKVARPKKATSPSARRIDHWKKVGDVIAGREILFPVAAVTAP